LKPSFLAEGFPCFSPTLRALTRLRAKRCFPLPFFKMFEGRLTRHQSSMLSMVKFQISACPCDFESFLGSCLLFFRGSYLFVFWFFGEVQCTSCAAFLKVMTCLQWLFLTRILPPFPAFLPSFCCGASVFISLPVDCVFMSPRDTAILFFF